MRRESSSPCLPPCGAPDTHHPANTANQSINQSINNIHVTQSKPCDRSINRFDILYIIKILVRGIMGNVFYQYVADSRNQAGQRSLRSLKDLDAEPNRPPQNPPQHQPDTQQTKRHSDSLLAVPVILAADWSMTHSAPDMPGWTPSAMHTDNVRMWSATTLYAMSTFPSSAAPILPPYGPALDL